MSDWDGSFADARATGRSMVDKLATDAQRLREIAEADCGCRIPSPFDEVAEHLATLAEAEGFKRGQAFRTPANGEQVERLALEAIKAVTATTKDAVAGLSRIMAITRSAGVVEPYSELMDKPDVALIVNEPRTEWRHLFEQPAGCTVPPAGWRCTRTPGHGGPCAAVPDATPTEDARERVKVLEEVRQQGQREGFAEAVQRLRDMSATKPPSDLAWVATLLANQIEAEREPCEARTALGKKETDRHG